MPWMQEIHLYGAGLEGCVYMMTAPEEDWPLICEDPWCECAGSGHWRSGRAPPQRTARLLG